MEQLSADARKIVESSPHQDRLERVIRYTQEALSSLNIQPTELQWTILVNHLNEMVKRHETDEVLEGVDISLFSEVSKESIDLAKEVAVVIGDMPEEEAYVLSIHFETAKYNNILS